MTPGVAAVYEGVFMRLLNSGAFARRLPPGALRFARQAKRLLRRSVGLPNPTTGRPHNLFPPGTRFAGAYPTREAALAAIPQDVLAGYDHREVAPVSFERMCELVLWDYPILFWLARLLPDAPHVVDAGGHMGTKYRAFSKVLALDPPVSWTIYDLPEIVRAGRARAEAEGLRALAFVEDPSEVAAVDVFLASGLFQYLDVPIATMLGRLPRLPPHLLVNKVANWDGKTTFTLENFGVALVPYQIRNTKEFLGEASQLGYEVVDEWQIAPLSHQLDTHPKLGHWSSSGFYMRLRGVR